MNHRKLVKRMGKTMLRSGLTVATWGNISIRDERGRVYITPSGMAYDRLHTGDIVVTDAEGGILKGRRRPSTELPLHLAIYAARPDVRAIIHTHAPDSTVFAAAAEPIPCLTDEAAQVFGGTVRCGAHALPGSRELAENAVAALNDTGVACLLQSHGAVCVGPTMESAWRAVQVLEQTAGIYQKILSAGLKVSVIPSGSVEKMKQFLQKNYGQKQ